MARAKISTLFLGILSAFALFISSQRLLAESIEEKTPVIRIKVLIRTILFLMFDLILILRI